MRVTTPLEDLSNLSPPLGPTECACCPRRRPPRPRMTLSPPPRHLLAATHPTPNPTHHPTPYSKHPTPCSKHPTPYFQHPTPKNFLAASRQVSRAILYLLRHLAAAPPRGVHRRGSAHSLPQGGTVASGDAHPVRTTSVGPGAVERFDFWHPTLRGRPCVTQRPQHPTPKNRRRGIGQPSSGRLM